MLFLREIGVRIHKKGTCSKFVCIKCHWAFCWTQENGVDVIWTLDMKAKSAERGLVAKHKGAKVVHLQLCSTGEDPSSNALLLAVWSDGHARIWNWSDHSEDWTIFLRLKCLEGFTAGIFDFRSSVLLWSTGESVLYGRKVSFSKGTSLGMVLPLGELDNSGNVEFLLGAEGVWIMDLPTSVHHWRPQRGLITLSDGNWIGGASRVATGGLLLLDSAFTLFEAAEPSATQRTIDALRKCSIAATPPESAIRLTPIRDSLLGWVDEEKHACTVVDTVSGQFVGSLQLPPGRCILWQRLQVGGYCTGVVCQDRVLQIAERGGKRPRTAPVATAPKDAKDAPSELLGKHLDLLLQRLDRATAQKWRETVSLCGEDPSDIRPWNQGGFSELRWSGDEEVVRAASSFLDQQEGCILASLREVGLDGLGGVRREIYRVSGGALCHFETVIRQLFVKKPEAVKPAVLSVAKMCPLFVRELLKQRVALQPFSFAKAALAALPPTGCCLELKTEGHWQARIWLQCFAERDLGLLKGETVELSPQAVVRTLQQLLAHERWEEAVSLAQRTISDANAPLKAAIHSCLLQYCAYHWSEERKTALMALLEGQEERLLGLCWTVRCDVKGPLQTGSGSNKGGSVPLSVVESALRARILQAKRELTTELFRE